MQPVTVKKVIECASEPDDLWDPLTDTNRINHAIGLESFDIGPMDEDGRFHVSTRLGPFSIRMVEEPYAWVRPEKFSKRRTMLSGPLQWVTYDFALERGPAGGTRLTAQTSLLPRLSLLRPVLVLVLRNLMTKMAREVERLDAELARKPDVPVLSFPSVPGDSSANEQALTRASRALESALPADLRGIAGRLAQHVRDATDVDLARIRPFECADAWQENRRRVVEVFLQASVHGMLDLQWELVCPSCRTTASEVPSLADLDGHSHCELCDLNYDVSFDQSVEATFRPNAAVRPVKDLQFCTGGPGRTPHVIAQSNLHGLDELELRLPPEPGRYRLYARGGATASVHAADDATPNRAEVKLLSDRFDPATMDVAPGARIVVKQVEGRDRHVKLERVQWASRAATAQYINTIPAFRNLFSHEVLRPGMALQVSRAALVFTDLSGSTALYTEHGDAAAFSLVHDHFDLITHHVEEHDGVIIKTIGDAVMATFADEADAVRACVSMQRAFADFRKEHPLGQYVQLKVGMFAGPCYAITANGVLDYFGQSVNVAARLEGQAGGGQIVLPKQLADEAAEAGWLGAGRIAEQFDAVLKGIAEPLRAVRVEV